MKSTLTVFLCVGLVAASAAIGAGVALQSGPPPAPATAPTTLVNGGDDAMTQILSGRWTVTRIAEDPVPKGIEVWLEITADGIAGLSGCNNFSATMEVAGSGVILGPVESTRKACGQDAMSVELQFLRAMDRVNGYAIGADGLLTLSGFGTSMLQATRD